MINKLSTVLLCVLILLCLVACGKSASDSPSSPNHSTSESNADTNKPTDHQPSPERTDDTPSDHVSSPDRTDDIPSDHQPIPDRPDDTPTTDSPETEEPSEQEESVFDLERIRRVTLYTNYGSGEGCEVPDAHMAEITSWLSTFTIGEKAPDLLPPGTNTYYVEVEYTDGEVVKQGLDVISVDGTTYRLECGKRPDCFMEILSGNAMNPVQGNNPL